MRQYDLHHYEALQQDGRYFANRQDTYGICRKCGCSLILLPEDKRNGYCFDCYDPYGVDDANIMVAKPSRAAADHH